jgi:S1-C subfamily serine protease
MRFLIFVLALLMTATQAPASAEEPKFDWWYLGSSTMPQQGKALSYVDRSSIKRQGSQAVAMSYGIVERPFPNGEKASMAIQLYDCKKPASTLLRRTSWDAEGKQRDMLSWQEAPANAVTPGSAGEVVWRFVCGKGFVTAQAVADPRPHALSILHPGSASAPAQAAAEAGESGYGTGFFVSASGQLVTSYHVVDGARAIYVQTADGTRYPAKIARSSAATDLAVLEVNHRPTKYLSFGAVNAAKPGDRVFTIGFPVMELLGAEPKFTDGVISSLSGVGNEAAFAQISVPVQPGNSGGPLVNEKGEVVGVIAATAAVREYVEAVGTLPQNIGWAVRGEYVLPLVKTGPAMPSKSRDEAIDAARRSVALILVER